MADKTKDRSLALHPLNNVQPLHEAEWLFDRMVGGWGDQQVSRGLAAQTVKVRKKFMKRFADYCEKMPWDWGPGDLEDFTTSIVSGASPVAKSTVRAYQMMIRIFCDYITDRQYPWVDECEARFGVIPQQICHEWNTVAHLDDYEGLPGKRALSYDELETFFNYADGRVESIVQAGKKGGLTALRDSQIFKTIYAFGLRRAECTGLDLADLRPNPAAPQFGTYGSVEVRWGKGSKGSGPRRRTVLMVPEMAWAVEGLKQWVDFGRLRFKDSPGVILWPTERGSRISNRYLDGKFAELRDAAGLPSELTLHSLRHSFVTNLIEWDYSEKFVQDQVGHRYAATTAIYTSVGSDYKNRVIKQALVRLYGDDND